MCLTGWWSWANEYLYRFHFLKSVFKVTQTVSGNVSLQGFTSNFECHVIDMHCERDKICFSCELLEILIWEIAHEIITRPPICFNFL